MPPFKGVGETLVTVGPLSGTPEDFGPAAPTVVDNTLQYVRDITGLQKNVLIAIGVGVLAYFTYQMYYGE